MRSNRIQGKLKEDGIYSYPLLICFGKDSTSTAFEREWAEGGGVFFGRSKASEKKNRNPVKRERARQSHPCKNLNVISFICLL